MPRENLVVEAMRAGKNAAHNLEWMRMYPDRFDQSKRKDMELYLTKMIQFSLLEIENARRLGRTSLSTRSKELLRLILPYSWGLSRS